MTVPFVAASLLDLAGIRHGFFGRQGGVSQGIYASLNCGPGSNDDPTLVQENRARAVRALGSGDMPLHTVYQVHGADVVTVSEPLPPSTRPQADAQVTNRPGIVLGILTADCTPVLFADPEAGVIGCAHAGWKGALSGVLAATVTAMTRLGAKPERIRAAIGPTIAQASYEVDDAFRRRFEAADPAFAAFFADGRPGHAQFDLPAFVRHRLQAAGVGSVEDLALDTYVDDTRFFSYRRATHRGEKDYGRQLSAIALDH
jgi:YfiH family protein